MALALLFSTLRFLAALAVPAASLSVVYEDDIEAPLGRQYRGLGAAAVSNWQQLWPGGRVNYFIDQVTTDPTNSAPPIPDSQAADIRGATAHWEAHTCIRFHECATEAACPEPFMKFRSHASRCSSPMGIAFGAKKVNVVNFADTCTLMTAVHEIGHGLGLDHEQSRNDRDDHVYIDMNEVKSSRVHNFRKTGAVGRSIGPYDYASILHYQAFAHAKKSAPTIVASHPIGQRSGLSHGDIAAIAFMYNNCDFAMKAPTCIASREVGEVHVVAQGQAWRVEFNGLYKEKGSMTVSYAAGTAPTGMVAATESEGAAVGDTATTTVTFTPDSSVAGQALTLAATFTAGGKSATCSVDVIVSAASAVCFGIASDDPAVCTGRGTCVNDALAPCQCQAGYGGVDCGAFAECPMNSMFDFEGDVGMWRSNQKIYVDGAFAAVGSALRVGDPGLTTRSQAQLQFVGPSKPRKISYYFARMASSPRPPKLDFRDAAGNSCFSVPRVRVEADRFYKFEYLIDWGKMAVVYLVDGKESGTASIFCNAGGIVKATFFGNGWLDEFKLLCTRYVAMTGDVADADGLSQADLRNGGAMITLTLVGDMDEWVDTAANKQAVVDSLTGDTAVGWDQRKGNVLDASLVEVDAGDKQVLRIGPLKGDAGYVLPNKNVVGFELKALMFTSGTMPEVVKDDLSFVVHGACEASVKFGFDDASGLPTAPAGLKVSATEKKGGAGAMLVPGRLRFRGGSTLRISDTGLQPSTGSMWVRLEDTTGPLEWDMGALKLKFANGGVEAAGQVLPGASLAAGTWHHVEFAFDWTTATASLTFSGQSVGSAALVADGIEEVFFNAFVDTYIDEVEFACDAPPPQAPATPAPATVAPATPAPRTAAPATQAPMTAAPATLTPRTAAPETSAPATPAPITRAPGTFVPGSPAPATAVPTSPMPATLVPATAAPTSAAPSSPPGATGVPGTPMPATTVPGSPAPATAVPTSPVPATLVPATAAPTSAAPASPATTVPGPPAPATVLPAAPARTLLPGTPAPATLPPSGGGSSPAPASAAPRSTPAPAPLAPQPSAPPTLVSTGAPRPPLLMPSSVPGQPASTAPVAMTPTPPTPAPGGLTVVPNGTAVPGAVGRGLGAEKGAPGRKADFPAGGVVASVLVAVAVAVAVVLALVRRRRRAEEMTTVSLLNMLSAADDDVEKEMLAAMGGSNSAADAAPTPDAAGGTPPRPQGFASPSLMRPRPDPLQPQIQSGRPMVAVPSPRQFKPGTEIYVV
eukprot:TRINITY_DN3050_c0_g1_i10.p1 TRINITY_DN3050_c0_g1~~TRINITY_DN3050_c0_g1_i10.p1  ORF type:complete len:1279 (+),score=233.82 TRINITY_DN3050_c0_g1_i10:49-3837(+)